jgi:hypothetical protein
MFSCGEISPLNDPIIIIIIIINWDFDKKGFWGGETLV